MAPIKAFLAVAVFLLVTVCQAVPTTFSIDGVDFVVEDKAKITKPIVIKNADGTFAARITPNEFNKAVKGKGQVDTAADAGIDITLGERAKLSGKTVIINQDGQAKVQDSQSSVEVGTAVVEAGQANTYIILEDNAKLKGKTTITTVGGDAVTARNGGKVVSTDDSTFIGGDATTTLVVSKGSTLAGSRTIETRGGSVATVDGPGTIIADGATVKAGDASNTIITAPDTRTSSNIKQTASTGDIATIEITPAKKRSGRRNLF